LASLCAQRLKLGHVSTGELFRQAMARRSAVGERVRRYVTSGGLVPDALVVQVMARQLRAGFRRRGFVLDGFPRTIGQARGLDRELHRLRAPLDGAVYLSAPRSILVRRLSGRRVCEQCGANYHIRNMRPRRAGWCDRCNGRLSIRKDDEPRTIARRLAIDQKAATPLLRYYKRQRKLYRLDGRGSLTSVFGKACQLFRRQGWLG
jgi:adenylate kinase